MKYFVYPTYVKLKKSDTLQAKVNHGKSTYDQQPVVMSLGINNVYPPFRDNIIILQLIHNMH